MLLLNVHLTTYLIWVHKRSSSLGEDLISVYIFAYIIIHPVYLEKVEVLAPGIHTIFAKSISAFRSHLLLKEAVADLLKKRPMP